MMRPPGPPIRLRSVVMVDERNQGVVLRTGLGSVTLDDTLITGGAVRAAMDDVFAHADHLNTDIAGDVQHIMQSATGQRFYNDWITWYAQFQNFYSAHVGSLSAAVSYFAGETVAQLRNQAAQYNDFEARYAAITGHGPSFNPGPPSSNDWLGLPVAAWVGIGAGTVGLVAIAWSLSSVSRITAPLRGRRRRR